MNLLLLRTDNVNVAHLADHRLRVDLAHVAAGVFLLDSADVQVPGALVVVGDGEAADPGHHLTVDR